MYYLLTENFKSQEAKLVEIITEAVPVKKIYMLGSSLLQQRTESVFMTDAPSCRKVGHYWLLALVSKDCGFSDHYVQDKIENNCRHFIPVTAIVMQTEKFSNQLAEGHRFARTVGKIGVLLHGSSDIPSAIPDSMNEEADKKAMEAYCAQGRNRVNEFIAGADLYRIRKQNGMAAFMLHQAAEQALHTILQKATGLCINTHNIDKLLRYCGMISYQIPAIFPGEGEAGERLSGLLQRAYIDARYRDDFTISARELVTITERIRTLQEIM